MDAFVKGAGQHRIGDDDIERFEVRNAREQIPVRGAHAVRLERFVRHGEHGVPIRSLRWLGHEPRAQQVLIVTTLCRAALEVPECGDQETRLSYESFGSAIDGCPRLEHAEGAPLEVVHAVLTTLELVIQAKNLGDKTWPQMKWRLGALLLRDATSDAKKDLSFCSGQNRTRAAETLTQSKNDLARRHQIREHQRAGRRAQYRAFDRAEQERCRGACRDDDDAIARVEWSTGRGERNDGGAEGLKIGDSDQASCTRRKNHSYRLGYQLPTSNSQLPTSDPDLRMRTTEFRNELRIEIWELGVGST